MKVVCAIILIILVSCNNEVESTDRKSSASFSKQGIVLNTKSVYLHLKDSQGMIILVLPERYDTLVSWTHYSGVPGKYKYRYQSKMLPVTRENGSFWSETLTDSIDRFTIVQRRKYGTLSHLSREEMIGAARELAKRDGVTMGISTVIKMKLVLDTFEIIDSYPFAITAYEGYNPKEKSWTKTVVGVTPHKDDFLQFHFLILTKHKSKILENFIEESRQVLERIKIIKTD